MVRVDWRVVLVRGRKGEGEGGEREGLTGPSKAG